MTDTSGYDDVDSAAGAAPAAPAFSGAAPVFVNEAPVRDIDRTEQFIRGHQARAGQYMASFEDLMKQRTDAVEQARAALDSTIQELRDRHNGANGGINLPLLALGASMLGTHGDFGTKLGAGLMNMGEVVKGQRQSDDSFLQGLAALQQRQQALSDVPLKDAATFARMGALNEDKNVSGLERALITSKAERPTSLGGGLVYDPKRDVVINGYTGQTIMGGNLSGQGATVPGAASLLGSDTHGDDFLSKISDPVMRSYVKSVGDYEAEMPHMSRSPAAASYMQTIFDMAKQYNPDFDQKQYATIQKGMKDWTGNGQMNQRMINAGSATGHLANLQEAAAALGNGDIKSLNSVENLMSVQTGDPRVQRFQAALLPVVTEMTKFLGGGHAAEGTMNEWLKTISQANSPKAMQAAIEEFVKIMHTQLEQFAESKTRDLGGKKIFKANDLIGPEAAATTQNVFANDISTPGGLWAVNRRGMNRNRELAGQAPLPVFTASQWEKGLTWLKAHNTPAGRKEFDASFGDGTAARVLGK